MCDSAQQTTTTQTHAQISTLETADWNWQEQPRDSICKLFWLPRHHVLAAFYLYQVAAHRRDSSKTTGLLSKVFTGSHQSRISSVELVNLGTHCLNMVASTWLLFFLSFFFLWKAQGLLLQVTANHQCDQFSQTRRCRAYRWYSLLCLVCGPAGLLLNWDQSTVQSTSALCLCF